MINKVDFVIESVIYFIRKRPVATLALLIATWALWLSFSHYVKDPVQVGEDALRAAGQELTLIDSQCPGGWDSHVDNLADAGLLETCTNEIDGVEYVVALGPDGECATVRAIGRTADDQPDCEGVIGEGIWAGD